MSDETTKTETPAPRKRIRIGSVKGDGMGLQRTYAYPAEAPHSERFHVTLKYLSPSLFAEQQDKNRIKVKSNGRRGREAEEPSIKQYRETMAKEVLIRAVSEITGVTLRKLKRLIVLKADEVKALGGLDAEVEMDQENILDLLNVSFDFWQFVFETCTDIREFQDEDWEEQVGNSESGLPTNTVVSPQ
jgi:hypothetical protein